MCLCQLQALPHQRHLLVSTDLQLIKNSSLGHRPTYTALRETHEEIGVNPADVTVLGELGFIIQSVVFK